MISFGPFLARHLEELNVQPAQRWTMGYIPPHIPKVLEGLWSNTIFKDGRPVVCGGVIEQRPNYGILWSFVGCNTMPEEFREIHGLVKMFVNSLPYERLEMHVDVDFLNGHRWAKALGFRCEAYRMRRFLPNGGDASLYARVKRG